MYRAERPRNLWIWLVICSLLCLGAIATMVAALLEHEQLSFDAHGEPAEMADALESFGEPRVGRVLHPAGERTWNWEGVLVGATGLLMFGLHAIRAARELRRQARSDTEERP